MLLLLVVVISFLFEMVVSCVDCGPVGSYETLSSGGVIEAGSDMLDGLLTLTVVLDELPFAVFSRKTRHH